jgi:cardiolipin synthase
VKIFRYQTGFLHQKVVLSDGYAAVGTGNLDNRSFRLNFEITGVSADAAFVHEVAEMLQRDFEQSLPTSLEDATQRPWYFQAACRAARLLSPIL